MGGEGGAGGQREWRRQKLAAEEEEEVSARDEEEEEVSAREEEEESRVCAEIAARVGLKMGWGGGENGSVVDLEEEIEQRVKELEFSLEKMRSTEVRFDQVQHISSVLLMCC